MLTAKAHAGWVDESSKQNGVNSRANLGGILTVEVLSASANEIALWYYVSTQQTDPTNRCIYLTACVCSHKHSYQPIQRPWQCCAGTYILLGYS